jgi:hypothetical protein
MAFIEDYRHGSFASEVDDANLVAVVRNVTTGNAVKRFTGETAWSDAQREVTDLALQEMYG